MIFIKSLENSILWTYLEWVCGGQGTLLTAGPGDRGHGPAPAVLLICQEPCSRKMDGPSEGWNAQCHLKGHKQVSHFTRHIPVASDL